jgi:uncharacterized protein (TIGR02246 family)
MNADPLAVAAIGRLADEWTAAWNAGDVEALLGLYTDEPVLLPQGQPAVVGKAAIRLLYESVFREYRVEGEGVIVEAAVSGDLGYFWSSYTLTARPRGPGDPTSSKGKSLFVLNRREDGSWKIARLMDNSDDQ